MAVPLLWMVIGIRHASLPKFGPSPTTPATAEKVVCCELNKATTFDRRGSRACLVTLINTTRGVVSCALLAVVWNQRSEDSTVPNEGDAFSALILYYFYEHCPRVFKRLLVSCTLKFALIWSIIRASEKTVHRDYGTTEAALTERPRPQSGLTKTHTQLAKHSQNITNVVTFYTGLKIIGQIAGAMIYLAIGLFFMDLSIDFSSVFSGIWNDIGHWILLHLRPKPLFRSHFAVNILVWILGSRRHSHTFLAKCVVGVALVGQYGVVTPKLGDAIRVVYTGVAALILGAVGITVMLLLARLPFIDF
ncbi:hypothetical protein DFS33DRAFT_1453912 [Desarmillaria ectypa]|nr:hypothetical protein DFS33DRAFT_1453912 [Desarmillaria ectypa]